MSTESNTPKISIVIPTYNRAEYLADCIRSILAQTYKNLEVVVMSDGCTDSTPALMDYYVSLDKRVQYFHRRENKGIAFTRNEGLTHTDGQFVSPFDSDDVMQKERLAIAHKTLTKTKADVFYSAYARANERGEVQDGVLPPKHFSKAKTDVGEILDKQLIPHVTVVAKRKCFEEHPYNNAHMVNDDLNLVLSWWKADYTFCMSPEPLVLVRYHDQSTSATKDSEVKAVTAELRKIYADR